MNSFLIVAFYKFSALENYTELRESLIRKMKDLNLKGTIILAAEGVNGSFSGRPADVAELIQELKSLPGFADLVFSETFDETNPFSRIKVKIRNEIVSLGKVEINPKDQTGEHVHPEKWNALITSPDVVLIDTRNDYEVLLGSFDGAINPETENFRDFPEYVEKHLMDKKDKKIAMFCTGGIRCEKSTAYLKAKGFDKVYQLEGGILNYLSQVPEKDSKWHGSCFVFDDRVALDSQLQSLTKGSIDLEWKNNHKKSKIKE